ncbi:MAG TPA: OmpA family protein [Bacteroidia bacterium]
MKKLITILLTVLSASLFAQTNVEFDKDNFKDRKDEFKEARKNFNDGKELFEKGMADYVAYMNGFAEENGYYPVSRRDYFHRDDEVFMEALPFLEKAQKFNPDNAKLNWMIGFTKFQHKHQSEECIPYLEKALKLNADVDPQLPYILGWAYQLHYKWDEANTVYSMYKSKLQNSNIYAMQVEDVAKKIQECSNGKKYMANPQRVFIDNMGSHVNSAFPEYSAYVSADESVLTFTSRRNNSTGAKMDELDHSYFEDIYICTKKNGEWSDPVNIGPPVNSEDHDATAGLSPDGTTLYIYANHGKGGGDIYESKLNGTSWSKPEKMNKNINSDLRETTVSEWFDGSKLYFVSEKKGGKGKGDIYFTTKDAKGKWGEAVNVGEPINTKYAEEGIFLVADGKTMYFSSRGGATMGGYDIFKTTFENGKWSTPENLGYPVNSPDDDVYFVISGSGRRGYYASAKDGGYGEKDLYMITFLGPEKPGMLSNEDNLLACVAEPIKTVQAAPAMEIVSNPLTILKGTITDAFTQKPLETTIELVDNTKNEVIATFKSNSATGKYLVMLPSGKNYGIAVKAEGYLFHSENFDIPASSGYQEIIKDIQLKNIAVGSKIVLKNIFFDVAKATLRPESTNELERLVKLLNDVPTLKIEIGSHTDSDGSDDSNNKLSQARSESVVNYLISKGIAKERLQSKGYGETKPIAPNDTKENKQQNRRSEFEILSK